MIPLTVCRVDRPEWYIQAALIVVLALILGSAIGWTLKSRHWLLSAGAAALVSFSFPVAAVYGIWPFDGRWKYDCGATPNPNIWVYYALLGCVPIALIANSVVRRVNLK